MIINIDRIYQHDCTIGVLTLGDFRCFTLELPYKDNLPNVSCIPEGTYHAELYNSPKHGTVIKIRNVVNRTYIEIHAGNYTSQVEGCILVGDSLKDINGDGIPDVTNSKATLGTILSRLSDEFYVRVGS